MFENKTLTLSIVVLVAANLLPVLGVLLWDWDVFLLLLLFWCENVIIGLYGIAKIALSGSQRGSVDRFILPVFFLVHYGGFMFGHFIVLFGLYSSKTEDAGKLTEPTQYLAAVIDKVGWLPIVALFISHGWSFVTNFLGSNERLTLSPSEAMALPYKRMVVTHVALIAGGFLLASTGQPLLGLLVLLGMKIALDVTFHKREHTRLTTEGAL